MFKKLGNIFKRSWYLIKVWYKNLVGGEENRILGRGFRGVNVE